MKCFFHDDNDGRCAGFWVRYFTKEENVRDYIPINHGVPFPLEKVSENETVYIVDFTISVDEMDDLLMRTKNVIWIDHHYTAIDRYRDYKQQIQGLRVDGVSGCQLTYAYFMMNGKETVEDLCDKAPSFSKYIADQDIWEFRYGNKTKCFCLAFPSAVPTDSIWIEMLNDDSIVEGIIKKGEVIKAYREDLNNAICQGIGYERSFQGFKCFVVNQCFCNSAFFESISGYDIYIACHYTGKYWSYTLFSQSVNVGDIARKYPGGGGHKDAAGFETKDFIFQVE